VQVDDSFSGLDFGMDGLSLAIAIDASGAETERANEIIARRWNVLVDEYGDCASHVAVRHGLSSRTISVSTRPSGAV
jgi:hypothetical protein